MCMQVGHVGVHSCQVLRSQQFTAPELLESAAGAGFQPAIDLAGVVSGARAPHEPDPWAVSADSPARL